MCLTVTPSGIKIRPRLFRSRFKHDFKRRYKPMTKIFPLLLVLFAFSLVAFAQPKVYIAPMEGGFDSFLAAALIENGVPVTITTVEGAASFIISGQAVKGQNHWYDVVFGAERDRNQGSIRLLKVSDRSI